jgi:predicted Zn-dependent protease
VAESPEAAAFAELAGVQFSRGEFGDTEHTLQRALRSFPDNRMLKLFMVWTLCAQGRQREALEALDALRSMFPAIGEAWSYHRARANLLAVSGTPGPVWEEARQTRDQDEEVAGTLAADLALLGDVPHARELGAQLRPRTPEWELADAVLAWRSGDTDGARSRLRALDAVEPMSSWSMPPSFVLAEIASATGNDVEVLESVTRFRTLWNHLGSRGGWIVPRALLLEARAQARLGRAEAARASLDRFLAQRAHADPGDSIAAEARAMRAALERASGAPR